MTPGAALLIGGLLTLGTVVAAIHATSPMRAAHWKPSRRLSQGFELTLGALIIGTGAEALALTTRDAAIQALALLCGAFSLYGVCATWTAYSKELLGMKVRRSGRRRRTGRT